MNERHGTSPISYNKTSNIVGNDENIRYIPEILFIED